MGTLRSGAMGGLRRQTNRSGMFPEAEASGLRNRLRAQHAVPLQGRLDVGALLSGSVVRPGRGILRLRSGQAPAPRWRAS